MLLSTQNLKPLFEKALTYQNYLATGTEEQQKRWNEITKNTALTNPQKQLLQTFTRSMNILVVSGIWCGDCVTQVPLIAHIAHACPQINLRIIDRDNAQPLNDQLTINAGQRVPFALFLAEDFEFCAMFGDRSLTRYRAIAQQQLGPACATGLFIPPPDELAQTLQDWLNECERIQLMLRLSTRLRKKHHD